MRGSSIICGKNQVNSCQRSTKKRFHNTGFECRPRQLLQGPGRLTPSRLVAHTRGNGMQGRPLESDPPHASRRSSQRHAQQKRGKMDGTDDRTRAWSCHQKHGSPEWQPVSHPPQRAKELDLRHWDRRHTMRPSTATRAHARASRRAGVSRDQVRRATSTRDVGHDSVHSFRDT